MTKTHLLNLGAKQLNTLERARIVRTIVRLTNVPNSSKYNGRLLYKIFKTYLKKEISKCYRTFFTHYITKAALINYGLNEAEHFTEMDLSGQAKELYEQAQRDFQVKALNWYSKRGYDMEKVKNMMAGGRKETTSPASSGGGVGAGTRSATKPAIKRKPTGSQYDKALGKVEKPIDSDDDTFGY